MKLFALVIQKMDFIDKMRDLQSHVQEQVKLICEDNAPKEEATKTALIQPFLNDVLGYNVRDLKEVKPEFSIDNAGSKDQRVDYAILTDGKPIILIECKCCTEVLERKDIAQLRHYYPFIKDAKFGILTNGIIYKFYADLEEENILDEEPFLELDILNIKDPVAAEVKNFIKPADIDSVYATARRLKYMTGIRKILEREFDAPSEDFVKFFAGQVHKGFLVKGVVTQFKDYTKKVCDEFIQDKIDDFFKAAKDRASLSLDDLEPEIEQKGSKYFMFNGETFEVRFWKDMVPKICSIMASEHPGRIEEILTIKGRTNPYFSKNPGDLGAAAQIEGTDIYAETYNYTKNWSLHISKRIVSMFGHSENDVSITN
jgi:hypothetical protein